MNLSIGQNCLNKKKPIWVYSSSTHKRDRNNYCLHSCLVDQIKELENYEIYKTVVYKIVTSRNFSYIAFIIVHLFILRTEYIARNFNFKVFCFLLIQKHAKRIFLLNHKWSVIQSHFSLVQQFFLILKRSFIWLLPYWITSAVSALLHFTG